MNSTDVSVNIAISYFLLVINALINIITARKQHLQYMHFNEENFSSSYSSIYVIVITLS